MPKRPPIIGSRTAGQTAKAYRQLPSRKVDQQFYDSAAWQRVRAVVLARDFGLCQACKRKGIISTGREVDHIEPRKQRPDLALDPSNCETNCRPCHNMKRRSE